MNDILYLVVPCYNEEPVLPETVRELTKKLNSMIQSGLISPESRMVFVNDGSKDRTWELIEEYHETNPLVSGIKLSRNRGHQFAVLAGLMTVKEHCDMAITLDADLQDDIDVLDEFVRKYKEEGCEIVYGVRNSRETDTFFKRFTAESFYRLMSGMGVDIVFNHADYRLMSRKALDALAEYKEVNLFLRGVVPLIGYKTGTVEYARKERAAGESKYPLKKMLSFAMDGITSFSIKPIRMITMLGVLAFIASIVMAVYTVVGFFMGTTVSGWASIIISIWGFGGLILIALGMIGEYIGKIYMETKARPRYLVEKFLN
ncbi:glycosyltransferase family 2 protein [Mediterraneibacter glycyrrhizinilyticus]|nr:glycosyltransferase family 2 protein [Mediterraneibacter glycyrrhizinilyticus]MBM6853228.1 glycosyltransferase family 2 protein [Mediterraneibacter glycyrrhizinilyticus]